MPSPSTLLAKLEGVIDLTEAEAEAARSLPARRLRLAAGETLRRAGDKPTSSFLIVEGLVATAKIEDGRRSILNVSVPGDVPGLSSLYLRVLDVDLVAIDDCELAVYQHDDLRPLCLHHPRLAVTLWSWTLVTASIYGEWIVNVGHRSAPRRIAHLFCELVIRLEAVGLADRSGCELPLTQIHLGEATGLSPAHVNRTLRDLRQEGILIVSGGRLSILDWDRLVTLAQFRPDYLYLSARPPWSD